MQAQWQQVKSELLADKRKLGIMITLGVIALVLWARLAISHDPSAAQAAAVPQANAVASHHAQSLVTGTKLATDAIRVAEASSLKRNLFSFQADGYRITKASNFGSVQTKSAAGPTDEQVRLAQAQDAVAGLTLQSVMTGPHPNAVINGTLVGIGDTIHGFTLKKVLDRQAILEMNGIVVRLGM